MADPTTDVLIVEGDLLDQPAGAIVNPWNRNQIPWFILLPRGVSGAILKRGGSQPFKELARTGPMAQGEARVTSAGRLPFRAIIHIAALDSFWRTNEDAVRLSARNALEVGRDFATLAFPLLGAGIGGLSPEDVTRILREECERADRPGLRIVVFRP